MKIIDFRVRPPYGSIKESLLFTRKPQGEVWGLTTSASMENADMDTFMQEMDEAGIDIAVVPLRRAFGHQNDDLLKLIEEYPGRFIGFPCIDPNLPLEVSLAEIDKYITNGPCSGIMLETGKCNPPLYADDEKILPIYEKCEKENIPVAMSFGGFIPPDITYNDPKIIDRLAVKFPNLKMIICHAAWPYAAEMIHIAKFRANVYLVADMYMVNCACANDYIAAANYMLQDKFILGSAYPILPLKDNLQYNMQNLHPEVWEKVFYKNAAKVLGLE